MSKYTTELRYICEMMSGFSDTELETKTPDQVILAARSKIFNFAYPIYDASHKPELETKILRHYYTREINSETFGLWHLQLEATLCEIMPKYNRLYAAEARILEKELKNIDVSVSSVRTDDLLREDNFTRTDDLHDADRRDTTENRQDQHSGQSSSTRTDNLSEQDSTTRTDNLTQLETRNLTTRNKFSDTPQGTISNVDNDSYLTDYRNIGETGTVNTTNTGTQGTTGTRANTGTQTTAGTDEATDTGSTNGTATGTADHTGTQKNDGTVKNTGTQTSETQESGYRGEKYYAALLADYAEKILNIDLMIIKELNNLFFLLW